MLKKIFLLLVLLLNFVYPAEAWLAEVPLAISLSKSNYGLDEEIKAEVVFINLLGKPLKGSLSCAIISPNRDFPPLPKIQPVDLAPKQKISLDCSMHTLAGMPSGIYRLYAEARDSQDQIIVSSSREFTVTGSLSEIGAELLICADQACEENKAVFISGETIFLKVISDVNDLEIIPTLKDGQGREQPAVKFTGSRAQFKAEAVGSYIISLALKKVGWQDKEIVKDFAVIAEPVKIASAAVCRVDGQCLGQENLQNCPQDCTIKNKTFVKAVLWLSAVIVIFLIILTLIYLKMRKIASGSDVGGWTQ